MLTHVHLLVYTLWCWHTLRWELKFEGLREDGFLSPSRRACEAGFGAFRENEVHIFYCAGGKFGEVAGVFLAEKTLTGRWLRGTGRCV